jgi:hypothetical protein
MRKLIKLAWSAYRQIAAFKGLLEVLGIWKWIAAGGVLAVTALIGYGAKLPVWGRVLVSLAALAVILFVAGFALAFYRTWRGELNITPVPSKGVQPEVARSLPVILITWGEIDIDQAQREKDISGLESIMNRKAAERAAVGRDGIVEEFGFTLRCPEDTLENLTIRTISKGHYKVTFDTLPHLRKDEPGNLIPHISVDGVPDFGSEIKHLFEPSDEPWGAMEFTVTGRCKNRQFEVPYRAEGDIHTNDIKVYRDA